MRRIILSTLALLLASFSSVSATETSVDTDLQKIDDDECLLFEATGHEVCGDFYAYWQQYGGVEIFGFAISDEFEEDGIRVQYFERARLEHHPGVWPERGDILQGLLGSEITAEMRDHTPFQPVEAVDDCNYYGLTGHNICEPFLERWQMSGGLPIFGYPISEAFEDEDGMLVQYFERQRMEYQPGVWPERNDVLLGRLGAELLADPEPPVEPSLELLVDGLEGSSGSTIGPDGALYVTEGAAGRVTRVDRNTGEKSTFASGLPQLEPAIGFGGPVDIAFVDSTAYVLVTLVGPDVGGNEEDVVGIYRMDGSDEFTVIADFGAYLDPDTVIDPETIIDVPSGLQYQMIVYDGDLLVSDGHYNRILQVSVDGEISEMLRFGNDVPTGLALADDMVYIGLAGPVPHLPEDGEVVVFDPATETVSDVAAGAPLLVDVKFGPDNEMYALAQGEFPEGDPPGAPALPNTGAVMKADGEGSFNTVVDEMNLPSSFTFVENTTYIVTLTGEIWTLDLGH